MDLGTLIIFSGLPGTGKSTLATRLASKLPAAYLRIDTIEQGLRDICGIVDVGAEGYQLAHRLAQENLRAGIKVVADSVNPWGLSRNEWNRVASDIGANFLNIEVVCSDLSEHRDRVEHRRSSVPGLILPTWSDVLSCDYHSWEGGRYVCDTSGKGIEASLAELVSILESQGVAKSLRR